jgi:flagellar biosynthetic protein FliP
LAWLAVVLVLPAATSAADGPSASGKAVDQTRVAPATASGGGSATIELNRPSDLEAPAAKPVSQPSKLLGLDRPDDVVRTVKNVAIFGLISLAPAALLMVTSFPRINIVLILLRQALGSPQVPGNQVLTALSLLLTALVMRPVGEEVYRDAILPYQSGQMVEAKAVWAASTRPVKAYMVGQIIRYKHEDYLQALEEYAVPPSPGRVDSAPAAPEDFPLRVVAPAYLLSELTTAFMMGFYLYLPFLVIDLVVSSVLAATGLFMLPPSLAAMPVKLIVFVLADGWLRVSMMLLSSFTGAPSGSGP